MEPLEFREVDVRVVVPIQSKMVGEAGGMPLDFRYAMTFTVEDDLIARVEISFA